MSRGVLVLVIVVAMVLIGLGWFVSTQTAYTKIRDIQAQASQYNNATVRIRGQVVNVFALPLLNTNTYEVNDDSGSIWVMSEKGRIPSMGERVRVKGILKVGMIVNGQPHGTIIIEDTR